MESFKGDGMRKFSPSILVLDASTDGYDIVKEQAAKTDYNALIKHVKNFPEFCEVFADGSWNVVVTQYQVDSLTAYDVLDYIGKSGKEASMVILSEDIPEDESYDIIYAGACDFVYKDSPERLMPVIYREIRSHIKKLHHERLQRAVDSFSTSLRLANPDKYNYFHSLMEVGDKNLINTFDYQEALGFLQESGDVQNEHYEIIRQADFMRHIPIHQAEKAFNAFEEKAVKAGEILMQMGKPVDYFHIIVGGEAQLTQIDMETGDLDSSAILKVGEAFGEKTILQGGQAERGVKMLTDGIILRLAADVFQKLVAAPLVSDVEVPIAKAMLDNSYKLIDVRLEEEYEMGHIPGAILIPLHELQDRMDEIDTSYRYVVCCRSGSRSAAATFILAQAGFNVRNMEGGMLAWNYETVSEYVS
ncbi:conserved hypothetical protein [Desulfotalea psychrophila LSv54]|uniref:Uncharacterized protein n=2 Tax=Desulfotalea psychrophila TaxID=84980 RepID=Q6ANA5_DESPS|nr:conserved hypothetical protein [Desulfotalea psychrophila LSv54]